MTGTDKIDPLILAGRSHAMAQLDIVEISDGAMRARAHASGLILGARDFLVSKYGTRDTYNLLQSLADQTIDPALTS